MREIFKGFVCLLLAAGCAEGTAVYGTADECAVEYIEPSGAADPVPEIPGSAGSGEDDEFVWPECVEADGGPDSGPVAAPSTRVGEQFDEHYADQFGLTYEELVDLHQPGYLDELDLDPSSAEHYDGFVTAFGLSDQAQQQLDERGFVVVPAPPRIHTEQHPEQDGAGPASVFYDVYQEDLPVFVSADSILHAWHRSFDKLLEETETHVMIPALGELLERTVSELDSADQAGLDALFYAAVARKLLEPDWEIPAAVAAEVEQYLGYIESLSMSDVTFMGSGLTMDFSQFKPRGHYTHSVELERYFKAMMWLGRTDLVLYVLGADEISFPREEAAARRLVGALQSSGGAHYFEQMNRVYSVFVGRTNALTPVALHGLCEQAGLPGCEGDAEAMLPFYAETPPPEYTSRIGWYGDPPIAMRLFPQRFGYDSWVTNQTTMPRLTPVFTGGRAMAMPEDVAFALGADRAVEYFADEMELYGRENLPATLEAARLTMAALRPTAVDDTVYNHWLEGLMALAEPSVGCNLPQVMRTATWHDRKLEAILASWAELRHDTILLVEQSSGFSECVYPAGYVEPVVELYASLGYAAELLQQLYVCLTESLEGAPDWFLDIPEFLEHWKEVTARLQELSAKELAGVPMDDDDLYFFNEMVQRHFGGGCSLEYMLYTGWYPQLYWTAEWSALDALYSDSESVSGLAEPIVADVHTDADNGLALEVAVGNPGLMIVVIDDGEQAMVYGGPVSSFFSFAVPLSERMTDEEWYELVEGDDLPPRPAFAEEYWVY